MIFLSLLLLGAYVFAAMSLGYAVLNGLQKKEEWPIGGIVMAFLTGLGLLGMVWIVLGLLPGQWFSPFTVRLTIFAAVAIGGAKGPVRWLVSAFGWLGRAVAPSRFRQIGWAWGGIWLAILALVIIFGLCSALGPKGDGAAFYMAWPKLLTHTHHLVPMPNNYEGFTTVTVFGELHFAALIMMGPAQAAWMLPWVMGLAGMMMLLEAGRLCGVGHFGGWTLAVLFWTSTAVTNVVPGGKVDLFGTALGIAAVVWALRSDGRNMMAICFAGFFAGLAVLAKLSLLGTVVPMVGLIVVWRIDADESFSFLRKTGLVMLACLMMLLGGVIGIWPHILKNTMLFSQPLAPLIGGEDMIVAQRLLSPEAACQLQGIYPLALFLGQFPGMGGSINVAGLALWPLAFLLVHRSGWKNSRLLQVTVAAVLGVALWAIFMGPNFSLRYFLPPILLLLIVPAAGVEWVWRSPRTRLILKVMTIVVLVMALAERFNRPKGHLSEAVQFVFTNAPIQDVGVWSSRMAFPINELADPNGRVFSCSWYTYYLRPDLLANLNTYADIKLLTAEAEPKKRWRRLYDQGFRYLMADNARYRYAPDGAVLFTQQAVRSPDEGEREGAGSPPILLDSGKLPEEFRLLPLQVPSRGSGKADSEAPKAWRIIKVGIAPESRDAYTNAPTTLTGETNDKH